MATDAQATRVFAWLQGPGLGAWAALSFVFFAAPLAQKAYVLTALDVSFISVAFVVTLVLQLSVLVLTLWLERRRRWPAVLTPVAATAFTAANVFHFFFVLTNSPPSTYFAILAVACALTVASLLSLQAARFTTILCTVMLVVMLGSAWWEPSASAPASATTAAGGKATPSARRSVYVIAFDALTSRRALHDIYGVDQAPHVAYLEEAGFDLYDAMSPGYDTIDSFVEWFSLGRVHTSRNAQHFFNGTTDTPLYTLLRAKGFRIQFIYHSNYFGVDAGRIDSFYPEHNAISICEFVSTRYAYGICGRWAFNTLWKPALGWVRHEALLVPNRPEGGHDFVAERLRFASADAPRPWFSTAYVPFPGHAVGYPGDDLKAVADFKARMVANLPQLAPKFERLRQTILSHDPQAVIVILGDHGGWATGRWKLGERAAPAAATQALLDLDRRGILVAVYPKGFCRPVLATSTSTAALMQQLAECAS